MRLIDLKTQALRYVALGGPAELAKALAHYAHAALAVPSDLDARMKIADVLAAAGLPELAQRVYAAVAFLDVSAGRPLHAFVACQALAALGHDVSATNLKRVLTRRQLLQETGPWRPAGPHGGRPARV